MARIASCPDRPWVAALILLVPLLLGGGEGPTSFTVPNRPDAAAPATGPSPRVVRIMLTGVIEDLQHDYMKRALAEANRRQADIIIVQIDSPGGTVLHSELISKMLLVDRPRIVAYVENQAISGGAMVAYSAGEIYLRPDAKIGDIGVIVIGEDGRPERPAIGDKADSPVRAHFHLILDRRDWPDALFLKMTDWDRSVYKAIHPDGRIEYVIDREGAMEDFLAANPVIAAEKDKRFIEVYKNGELLTLHGRKAVDLGMATATVKDLDGLYARLGVPAAEVIDLTPSTAELTARDMRALAPILLGLAILFVALELKTPGVGIWAILAGVCGVAFLICQFYLHLANHVEVIILGLGLAMLATDLAFGLTGGILAVAGIVVFLLGTFAAFVPDSLPLDGWNDPVWNSAFERALTDSGISACIMLVGFILFLTILPRLPFIRRISVQATVAGTAAGAVEELGGRLQGTVLRTTTALHPGGNVTVAGVAYSARSEYGEFIEAGAEVEVVDSRLGEFIVRRRQPPPPTTDATRPGPAA
jgi:membrane-bound serine protease (ClpP class)